MNERFLFKLTGALKILVVGIHQEHFVLLLKLEGLHQRQVIILQ